MLSALLNTQREREREREMSMMTYSSHAQSHLCDEQLRYNYVYMMSSHGVSKHQIEQPHIIELNFSQELV